MESRSGYASVFPGQRDRLSTAKRGCGRGSLGLPVLPGTALLLARRLPASRAALLMGRNLPVALCKALGVQHCCSG